MKIFTVKTMALSIALALGSTQAHSFSFADDTVEPKMGSVPAEEYMNKPVEPVTTPVTPQKDVQAEMQRIEAERQREEAEQARAAEQEQADIQAEMRRIEAERQRAEAEKRAALEREMREKERQRAEEERQARLAKEKAEREARIAAEKAAREQARKDAYKLGLMRNEALKSINSLNFVEMSDRVEAKKHYDEMLDLANGDKSNEHVKVIGLAMAQKYHGDANRYVEEHGKYLYSTDQEAAQWGQRRETGLKNGEYVEIIEGWEDRLDIGFEMLGLAKKYGNFDPNNLEPRQEKPIFQKVVGLESYLNWRMDELPSLVAHAEKLQEAPDYDPEAYISKSLGLDAVGKGLSKLGSGAMEFGGSVKDKAGEGLNKLKCLFGCD